MENAPIVTDFSCPCCDAPNNSKIDLIEHIKYDHENSQFYKCAKCDLNYAYEDDVLKHIELCYDENKIVYNKCAQCDSNFPSKNQFDAHRLLQHSFQCEHCNYSFTEESLYLNHLKIKHTDSSKKCDGKVVPCPLCAANFPSRSKLGRHFDGVHLKLRPHECIDCNIKFSQKATLNKHLKDHHPGVQLSNCIAQMASSKSLPDLCAEASEESFDSYEPKDALLINSDPEVNVSPSKLLLLTPKTKHKLQSATLINKEASVSFMQNEGKLVSPGNSCFLCQKTFSQRSSLNRHLRTVHSIDTNTGLPFTKSPTLKTPTKNTNGEASSSHSSPMQGSHKCLVCDISFRKLTDLKSHNADLHSENMSFQNKLGISREHAPTDPLDLNSFSMGEMQNVPEAVCTEEVGFSLPNDSYSKSFSSRHPSEAALALRHRTDISSETATVAESLLSLPESVLPFVPQSKDDVFNMRHDEDDEPMGADLKQRINELSLALEEGNDNEEMGPLSIASNTMNSLPASSSHSTFDNEQVRHNKRYLLDDSIEDSVQNKKARRETTGSAKFDENLEAKLRLKRSSLPVSFCEGSDNFKLKSKAGRREISYFESNSDDKTRPEDFVEGTFRCMECYTFFYSKKEFESHMEENHREIRPYKCSKCHSSFKSEKALDIHDAAVHEKLKPHICPKCGTGFGQKASLYRHIKEVNHETVYCSDCNSSYSTKRELADHINADHRASKPYKCDYCERSFVSKHQRHIHNITVHEKRRPYKCHQCGAAFGQRGSLHRHMKTVDHKFLPHKCTFCIRAFRKEDDLLVHMSNDHSTLESTSSFPHISNTISVAGGIRLRPYKCSYCKNTFKQAKQLDTHLRSCPALGNQPIEEEMQYVCPVCQETFGHESHLNTHMAKYHPHIDAANNCHQCSNCKTIFKKKKQLKKHIDFVKENANIMKCDPCHIFFCTNQQQAEHRREFHMSHNEAAVSIKQERAELEGLPCSSNFLDGLDYDAALGVKQNLEKIVDSINQVPKKVQLVNSNNLQAAKKAQQQNYLNEKQINNHIDEEMILSSADMNGEDERNRISRASYFHKVKKEMDPNYTMDHSSSNNNTYENIKYVQEQVVVSNSHNQYSNSNSPIISTNNEQGVEHSKYLSEIMNSKRDVLYESTKDYSRAVQDVQYSVGGNPISYGDAPMHRNNYEPAHQYSKNFNSQVTNQKPVVVNSSTSSTLENTTIYSMGGQIVTEASSINYSHPKQKGQVSPYKTIDHRKHYERSHYILPTTAGNEDCITQENSDFSIVSSASLHPKYTEVADHTETIAVETANNGNKSYIIGHNSGHQLVTTDGEQTVEYVELLPKPLDATSKGYVASEYITGGNNTIKYIEQKTLDSSGKNYVVPAAGHFSGSSSSNIKKYFDPMNLPLNASVKNYIQHHSDETEISAETLKYIQTVQKPLDGSTSQSVKYVEGEAGEQLNAANISKAESNVVTSKAFPNTEYSFAADEITESVSKSVVVEAGKQAAFQRDGDYFVPVTISQMHYLVKHVDDVDQGFDSENLTYATVPVNIEDLKDQGGTAKTNSLDTLYAVAIDNVDQEGTATVQRTAVLNNSLPNHHQYAVIIDNNEQRELLKEEVVEAKNTEAGEKNYALTVHLVEALEKHVNKNVDGQSKDEVEESKSEKNYQEEQQQNAAGTSRVQDLLSASEYIATTKENVKYEQHNIQYITTNDKISLKNAEENNVPVVVERVVTAQDAGGVDGQTAEVIDYSGNNVVLLKNHASNNSVLHSQLLKSKFTPGAGGNENLIPLALSVRGDNPIEAIEGDNDHFYVQSYMCWSCNTLYETKDLLEEHVKTHHQD